MLLENYHPQSRLEVSRTFIPTAKFPVFDVHTHFGALLIGPDYAKKYDTAEAVSLLRACGVRGVVNLDMGFEDAREKMLEKTKGFEDFFVHFGTVDVARFEDPDFENYVHRSLREGVKLGMRGIKLWKPIGLGYKDKAGQYLRPDDERLRCIYQTAGELGIPVLFHIADPAAFFDPVDERNERYEELSENPDWSFAAPEFYKFHELMRMQENMIASNPKTTFIIAHLGSYAENLAQVGQWLDKYPNMYVDIAARIAELGRQPYTARAFLEKHSARVLFGTDHCGSGVPNHPTYFRFLETFDEYFNPQGEDDFAPNQGRWNIYGVGLSDQALRDIYYGNALRLLGMSPQPYEAGRTG